MKLTKSLLSGTIIAILSSSVLLAAGNGSKPNGKPFIEIQGQFVEVVERIDNMEEYVNLELLTLKSRMTNLEVDVDSIGSRVLLLEQSIVEHQAAMATTESKIDTLIAASVLEDQAVSDAMASIASLEAQIAMWNEDPVWNEALIATAEAEIMAIRNLLTQEVEGLQAQIQKIENNSIAINNMQTQLDGLNASTNNANDLTPQCPGGTLTSNPDGSAECSRQGSETVMTIYFSPEIEVPAASYQEVTYSWGTYWQQVNTHMDLVEVTCPEGDTLNRVFPAMLKYTFFDGYYASLSPSAYYNYNYDYDTGQYTYYWQVYSSAPFNNAVRLSHSCNSPIAN